VLSTSFIQYKLKKKSCTGYVNTAFLYFMVPLLKSKINMGKIKAPLKPNWLKARESTQRALFLSYLRFFI
jgi:hypothetical protein